MGNLMYQEADIERIATSKPVNKTAALVVSKGYQYTPDKKVVCWHSDIKPVCREITPQEKSNPEFIDLTGAKKGHLTVLGMSPEKNVWYVRCDCGHYETRRSRSLKNPLNENDRCQLCRHIAHLKHVSAFNEHGPECKNMVDFY